MDEKQSAFEYVCMRFTISEKDELKRLVAEAQKLSGRKITITRFIKEKIFEQPSEKRRETVSEKTVRELKKIQTDVSRAIERYQKKENAQTEKYLGSILEEILKKLDLLLRLLKREC